MDGKQSLFAIFFMKMDAEPDLFDRVLLTSDKIWTQNKIIVIAYDRQLTKSGRNRRIEDLFIKMAYILHFH